MEGPLQTSAGWRYNQFILVQIRLLPPMLIINVNRNPAKRMARLAMRNISFLLNFYVLQVSVTFLGPWDGWIQATFLKPGSAGSGDCAGFDRAGVGGPAGAGRG